MRYSNSFPNLRIFLSDWDDVNFEVVMGVLARHFGDIFQLRELDSELKRNNSSPYSQLFVDCVSFLKGSYTDEEVIKHLVRILDTDYEIKRKLAKTLFVPGDDGKKVAEKQIGLFETLATGQHTEAKALSYLDIKRITDWMNTFIKDKSAYRYHVTQLSHLHYILSLRVGLLHSPTASSSSSVTSARLRNDVYFINASERISDMPKWVVLHFSSGAPRVFCESLLTESEKAMIEKAIGSEIPSENYTGGRAAHALSSGYVALAWVNDTLIRTCALTTKSDFFDLQKNYFTICLMSVLKDLQTGDRVFCDTSFYACYELAKTWWGASSTNYLHPLVELLVHSSFTGQLGPHQFKPHDFHTAASYMKSMPIDCILKQKFANVRTLPDGFVELMPLDERKANKVELIVPESLDYESLRAHYDSIKRKYKANMIQFECLHRDGLSSRVISQEDMATAMVLSLFRIRARNKHISIHLPLRFNLNQEEKTLIVGLMQENAYVCELSVNEGNDSLLDLQSRLLPVLARNRWLEASGYHPPMADNFWHQAAKYWLLYLNDQDDLLEDKTNHQLFKRCVAEMGLKGLQEVLSFLNSNDGQEGIENTYQGNHPLFYSACTPVEMKSFLDALISHLKTDKYFPFSELNLKFSASETDAITDLCSTVNVKDDIKRMIISDFIATGPDVCQQFLQRAISVARLEKWVVLIEMPEMDQAVKLDGSWQQASNSYSLLNDLIIRNRQLIKAKKELTAITAVSTFENSHSSNSSNSSNSPSSSSSSSSTGYSGMPLPEMVHTIEQLPAGTVWAWHNGGQAQLQLQQQQQIEQNRSVQQQQQQMQAQVVSEVWQHELITYNNIDELFAGFYQQFVAENRVYEDVFTQRREGASTLQNFFHTMINANPTVSARHAISAMTEDAAQALLKYHRQLSAGLNPDNLPRGFFTQRNKEGSLVLCFNPEIGYCTLQNPLTLKLSAHIPVASRWLGDFRLFDVDEYVNSDKKTLDKNDWLRLSLFASLQPSEEYTAELNEFINNTPAIKAFFDEREVTSKEKTFYLILKQVWDVYGMEGIRQFADKTENELELTIQQIQQQLLESQPEEVRLWLAAKNIDKQWLCALGQVYYSHGDEGVTLLLRKFMQIDAQVGADFYDAFHRAVLSRSDSFSDFLSITFMTAMDAMIERLSKEKNATEKQAFIILFNAHIELIGWDRFEDLWQGFSYFTNELQSMELSLKGTEFVGIPPHNMLVLLDRLLATLRQIPDYSSQQDLLSNFSRSDVTHGGVYYALQYEGFQFVEPSLQLTGFEQGNPTYSPDLSNVFAWRDESRPLLIKRCIASASKFKQSDFDRLTSYLDKDNTSACSDLILLLDTQYSSENLVEVLDECRRFSPDFKELITHNIHQAVYQQGRIDLSIDFHSLDLLSSVDIEHLRNLLVRYPQANLLEAVTILSRSGKRLVINDLIGLFAQVLNFRSNYSPYLQRESYKLAVLTGVFSPNQLNFFRKLTSTLSPYVYQQLNLLIKQLLSVNYDRSNLNMLSPDVWSGLLDLIKLMQGNQGQAHQLREAFLTNLVDAGLVFGYSTSGKYRALKSKQREAPADIHLFVDHEERLWQFLSGHIAINQETEDARLALKPIIQFFKRLQLNRTYLNEVEPLLAVLEKTDANKYWSSTYFSQLLGALQPETADIAFPISLVEIIIKDSLLNAKAIDSLEEAFPPLLITPLKLIIRNTVFSRHQQSLLCQLLLNEYRFTNGVLLLNQVIALLHSDNKKAVRDDVLANLVSCDSIQSLQHRLEQCQWLLGHGIISEHVQFNWNVSCQLWLNAMHNYPVVMAQFDTIKQRYAANPEKQALVLHILGFSCLQQGLRTSRDFQHGIGSKLAKLVERLDTLSDDEINQLAACYPNQPNPGGDDILRLMKQSGQGGLVFSQNLRQFLQAPFTETKPDFADVGATRQQDLRRLLDLLQVTSGKKRRALSMESAAKISLVFNYLKQIEDNKIGIQGINKPVSQMTQAEIATAFTDLSRLLTQDPDNMELTAQVWALVFTAMGRTTRKYPHLAQQFSLIANDLCITAPTKVLQLATGEGKSHFVAMRAARHAASGKTVDICTAKRSLAQRDLADYHDFYRYLNVSATTITAQSSKQQYESNQIHVTTMGDLSLFLDEQSYHGTDLVIDRENRIGLFDEFDFILFEEGRQTEYNYARPTGKTPKQMTWFYQAVNQFIVENHPALINSRVEPDLRPVSSRGKGKGKQSAHTMKGKITPALLKAFIAHLNRDAGIDEDKLGFVERLANDPRQIVQWLQSGYQAHILEQGVHFTVREELIEVGEEVYPMREIIPLSSDNQVMTGATYSAGVHQLLAVRLNLLARQDNKSPNYHIHAESHIISSQVAQQRMTQLWGQWEGFSGTISPAQAYTLNKTQQTEVLHVPTNQRDLRTWQARFFDDENSRIDALVIQLKQCLADKQSILIACKNDKAVLTLQQQLNDRLSVEEYAALLVYTNEDKRSPKEVLDEKERRENWQGGSKQLGIGLVASGFGRGDNVGVEAVFLLDVNNNNDLLQKGGRTARNGAEGRVHQFYLTADLHKEKQMLIEQISQLYPDFDSSKFQADTSNPLFDEVMLLREYHFNLNNQANRAYHKAMAELSGWGMSLIGRVADPQHRSNVTRAFSCQIKILEKNWITINSSGAKTDHKIYEIHTKVSEAAARFKTEYTQISSFDAESFLLSESGTEVIRLIEPSSVEKSPEQHATTKIAYAIMQLKGLAFNKEKSGKIVVLLHELAADKSRLSGFANQVSSLTTLDLFIDRLEIAVAHVKNPSLQWQEQHRATVKAFNPDNLLVEVYEGRRDYYDAMSQLIPTAQTQAIRYLSSPGFLSAQERLKRIMPMLNYLARLNKQQQELWTDAYFEQTDTVIESLEAFDRQPLAQLPPMAVTHLLPGLTIARRYEPSHAEQLALIRQIDDAIKINPEVRIRQLSRFSDIIKDMPEGGKSVLVNMLKTMSSSRQGVDEDVIEQLITLSEHWWHRGGNKYEVTLKQLWENLADNHTELAQRADYIRWCYQQTGKAWMMLLPLGYTLDTTRLNTHLQQLKTHWQEYVNADASGKSQKISRFGGHLHFINRYYELVAASDLDEAVKQAMHEQFRGLNAEQFNCAIGLVEDHKDGIFTDTPVIMQEMMRYLPDEHLPINYAQQLHQLLVKAAQNQNNNVALTIQIEAINRFRHYSFEKLTLLNRTDYQGLCKVMQYPDALEFLNDIMISSLSIDAQAQLLQALIIVLNYHEDKEVPLPLLLSGLGRFVLKPTIVLAELVTTLNNNPNHLHYCLQDDMVEHIVQTREPFRARERQIAHQVYRAIDNNSYEELDALYFNFGVSEQASLRTQMMGLLHSNILLGNRGSEPVRLDLDDDEDDVSQEERVSDPQEKLLEHGLGRYVSYAGQLLAVNSNPKTSDNGTITPTQQKELLQLAHEMRAIGQPTTPVLREVDISPLNQVLTQYRSSWFRSNKRIEQADLLVTNLFQTHRQGYAQVFNVLKLAMSDAMRYDNDTNRSRRFFKLNRSGSSRYYKTINKMQDLVIAAWSKDVNDIHSFQLYEGFVREQVRTMVLSQCNTIETYRDSLNDNFFNRGKKRRLGTLISTMSSLRQGRFSNEQLNAFVEAMNESYGDLPGHVRAAFKEIKARVPGLQAFINTGHNLP